MFQIGTLSLAGQVETEGFQSPIKKLIGLVTRAHKQIKASTVNNELRG